jgi:hypothetical protein|tara:strand:+ start:34 stop:666 length:633 start_codon:yes stop_codon:yes gene_type:complete
MATSLNPFGFLPARKRDGQPNSEGYGQIVQPVSNSAIGIVSLLPNNIFAGDVIAISPSGTITPNVTAKMKISGVFQGCQYVENGEPKFSRFFPGGTSVSDVKLHVITDPAQTYFVQADATLSNGEIGIVKNYTVTTSSGSTITGQSSHAINGAAVDVSTSTGAHIRVIGRRDIDGDSVNGNVASTDQYPIVECYINAHRYNSLLADVSLA